ncbi:Syntaxin-17 [Lamellibrachia satsuma]|nr:Syntaxin-17 [Lamellibrachia satsuma]
MLVNLATEQEAKRTLFDRYSDVSDDESDGVNPEDKLRTVLSMLDDASLPEFDFASGMASFEEAASTDRKKDDCTKYPLRRVAPSIKKFIKILQIDLDRLAQHRLNITRLKAIEDWSGLTREQTNASRTVQQVKANIKQLEQTRACVCDDDLPRFDASLADIQKQTIVAVVEFLDDQDIQADEPLSECSNSSKPMSVPASRINCEGTTRHRTVSETTEVTAFLLEDHTTDEIQLQVTCSKHAERSWEDLKGDLVELNSLMHDFSSLVTEQQESVDAIEENVSTSEQNVESGIKNLAKASKMKFALFPLAGALIGGTVGGPIGLVAGAKLGGLAALGGGVIGFTGGKFWSQRQKNIVATEMTNLSLKRARSLPDVSKDIAKD